VAGAPPRSTKKLVFYALAGVVALAALFLLGSKVGDVLPRFTAWVQGLGVWGPVAYIAGYVLATVLFAPGVILTLASGVIFGLVWGTVYTLIGATLGAACAFLIARYLARGFVERRLADRPRFQAIDRTVGRQGFKIVFLMRLSPVFPYNLLNYALGLTRVRFSDYLLACVGMIPGTLLYVYYGKALGSLAAVASGTQVQKGAEFWIFLGLGLVATIVVTTYITRIAGRALRQEIER
jgi:uncharacterized membrane protein YdjX (TVP38/TMEM64 family)